jgi:hypothetical protein
LLVTSGLRRTASAWERSSRGRAPDESAHHDCESEDLT